MNQKIIRLFIAVLLILGVMIMSGCAAPTPKLNISIKIEATASTWREGKQPYDIYGAIKEKLEKAGFEVVSEESTDYDGILLVDYKEEQGEEYVGVGEACGVRGTNITCNLRLEDKAGNTIFEEEIFAPKLYSASYLIGVESPEDNLYSNTLADFQSELDFKYLGEIIATKYGIGDAWAVEPFIQALKDEDSSVRKEAAFALREIKDARAVEPLIQALNDEYSTVREEAAIALGEIGDARAVEPLIQALKDENEYSVRGAAGTALIKIGEPAVKPLIQALKDEDGLVRWYAAITLGEIGDTRAVEPLTQALNDEFDMIRRAAERALEQIRGY